MTIKRYPVYYYTSYSQLFDVRIPPVIPVNVCFKWELIPSMCPDKEASSSQENVCSYMYMYFEKFPCRGVAL
jgi:hypothetical protein